MKIKYLLAYIHNNDTFDFPAEIPIQYGLTKMEPINVTELRMAMDLFGPEQYNNGTTTLKSIYYWI
jgi:hypothetical protein